MRIAIVRLSALGDIIQSSIVSEYMYKEGIETDWIVDSRFAQILDYSPYIHEVKSINLKNNPIHSLREILTWERYDMVIDFQGLLKSAILSKIIAKQTIGCDGYHTKEKPALLFYNQKLNIRNHTINRYREMINDALNISIDYHMIRDHNPYMGYLESDFTTSYLFSKSKKNIILIIGANAKNRLFQTKKWIELVNILQENILIPYGNESEYAIAKNIENSSKYVHILPKLNINELKATISKCDMLIGNDTGPSYIAWANNIKSVLIFGATPIGRVIENDYTRIVKAKTSLNSDIYDKNEFSINDIDVSEIINAIESF